ncbi:MAG: hypothetical protein J4G13_12520 [Dehalococcoidia bacterium]|nr:hypothetical protein [Dehalococcoidia bacterium]
MEISPITIFYGSMLGIAIGALFLVIYRQGRSPTHNDMHNLERQTREELRQEIKEAVRTATIEINAETNRRIDEVSHQIDGLRQDINRVLNALASHERINGRVVVNIQPDTEPAPTSADD